MSNKSGDACKASACYYRKVMRTAAKQHVELKQLGKQAKNFKLHNGSGYRKWRSASRAIEEALNRIRSLPLPPTARRALCKYELAFCKCVDAYARMEDNRASAPNQSLGVFSAAGESTNTQNAEQNLSSSLAAAVMLLPQLDDWTATAPGSMPSPEDSYLFASGQGPNFEEITTLMPSTVNSAADAFPLLR